MKILYSLNKNIDSEIFLSRFLDNCKDHQVKICYYGYSDFFKTDLNLNYFLNHNRKIDFNSYKMKELTSWIKNYNPDLIINDCEQMVGYLSLMNDFKIITCSYSFMKVFFTVGHRFQLFESFNPILNNLYINSKIYLPFFINDLDFNPKIRAKPRDASFIHNISQIRPYSKILSLDKTKEKHIFLQDKKLYKTNELIKINSDDYFKSIASSEYFLSELSFTTVIDCFYNQKYFYYFEPKDQDQNDLAYIINKINIGERFENFKEKDINCLEYSDDMKYLHEIIEEI